MHCVFHHIYGKANLVFVNFNKNLCIVQIPIFKQQKCDGPQKIVQSEMQEVKKEWVCSIIILQPIIMRIA